MDQLSSSEVVTINNQPAVHLGHIVAPGTNEVISIVIPLTQMKADPDATVPNCSAPQPEVNPPLKPQNLESKKSKGCPFEFCPRYSKPFSRAYDLKRHILRHEAKNEKLSEKVFNCDRCKEKFQDDASLQKHKGVCNNVLEVPFSTTTCQACNESFETISELQAHLETHIKALSTIPENLNQIKQEGCDTKYNPEDEPDDDSDFNLDDMLLIPKKKPMIDENSFCCQYCFKVFKSRWTLNSHVAVHEGRFQFSCDLCDKRFVRKSHYDSHVRSHETARPFNCEHCGKDFKEAKHRREHMKRKHPDNRSAIQSLFDSISESVSEELIVGS